MTSVVFDKDLPVGEADVTTPFTSEPHWIRFSVKKVDAQGNYLTNEEGKPIEVATWARKYPTRDAASSCGEDVDGEKRHMRGEPEQAWSEVGRMSGCPNPGVLAQYRNLSWTLHQAQAHKPEHIPHDHPAYPNSFRRQQEIREAGGDPNEPTNSETTKLTNSGELSRGRGPDEVAGGTPSTNPPKARSGTKRAGPEKLRKSPPPAKAKVPGRRGAAKTSKGKKVKGSSS